MRSLDERVRELEIVVRELQAQLDLLSRGRQQLGSRDRPLEGVYLKAKGRYGVGKLEFDDAATPAVSVTKVR